MFGYITVNQPELKIREFARYRAYYCGVCRDLREHYGITGQMTLSYDLTFLAVLLSALYEPEETMQTTRCLIHPLKKHDMIRNEYTAYAAAMNVLLAFHKALDDRDDEHRVRGTAASALLLSAYRKVKNEYPRQARFAQMMLTRIRGYEQENNMDEDLCAGCFGKLLACLFTPANDMWKPYLRRLGFYLGKYIYLLDAACDIETDIKSGCYNPLKDEYENPDIDYHTYCENLLRMMIAEAARAFEALPVLRDAELLRNILYAGVWTKWSAGKEGTVKTS